MSTDVNMELLRQKMVRTPGFNVARQLRKQEQMTIIGHYRIVVYCRSANLMNCTPQLGEAQGVHNLCAEFIRFWILAASSKSRVQVDRS